MPRRPGLVTFFASFLLASPAAAFCRLYTQSPSTADTSHSGCVEEGYPLAWRRSCISYTLVPSVELGLAEDDVRDTIDRSFATWMAVACGEPAQPLPLTFGQTELLGACSDAEYNRFGPNANTIVFASDWESRGADYVPEAYGLTLVWHNPEDGQIFDADIQLNLTREELRICGESCAARSVDLENVLTHEAGHFLGLAHSDVKAATMYGDAPIAEVAKRSLEPDDVAGACAIYGQRGAARTACAEADFAPRRGLTAECSQPMDPGGCAVGGRSVRGWGALVAAALALASLARRTRRS